MPPHSCPIISMDCFGAMGSKTLSSDWNQLRSYSSARMILIVNGDPAIQSAEGIVVIWQKAQCDVVMMCLETLNINPSPRMDTLGLLEWQTISETRYAKKVKCSDETSQIYDPNKRSSCIYA